MNDKKRILKTLNILYAEDDEITRENISKVLEMLTRSVIVAKNGKEAIEMFHKSSAHIAILDYIMPEADGISVAKAIREKDPFIPIVILSNHVEKEKLLNAIKIGVTDYLEKPIDFNGLVSTLLNCVQKISESGKLMAHISDNIQYNYIEKALHTPTQCERLTKNEYLFLEMLLERPESLISKDEIESRLFNGEVEPNTLRNLVYRLRKKISAEVIITVKDLGYMFRPE